MEKVDINRTRTAGKNAFTLRWEIETLEEESEVAKKNTELREIKWKVKPLLEALKQAGNGCLCQRVHSTPSCRIIPKG